MKRLIIDVREPEEYAKKHVKNAINISPEDFLKGAKQLSGVPKDTEIILYCISGSRSNVAMNILISIGFTNTVNGTNVRHVEAKYTD